jgi:ATP-dependent RNA helicase RhlE
VDILVATPGRLLDHIGQGTVRLDGVKHLVLDEADHMLDMGFLPDVRRIIERCPMDRQTCLFSATIPADIGKLIKWAMRSPEVIDVGERRTPAETVKHAFYPVAEEQKRDLLVALLDKANFESVIVFCRTKHRTDRLADVLKKTRHKVAVLHSNRSQRQREQALNGFRDGEYDVLVATDIAARGIDVQQVSHVINFDIPGLPEDYVHRIGRTGRAGKEGHAISLATPDQGQDVKRIERILRATIPVAEHPDVPQGRNLIPMPSRRPAVAAVGGGGGGGGRGQGGGGRGHGGGGGGGGRSPGPRRSQWARRSASAGPRGRRRLRRPAGPGFRQRCGASAQGRQRPQDRQGRPRLPRPQTLLICIGPWRRRALAPLRRGEVAPSPVCADRVVAASPELPPPGRGRQSAAVIKSAITVSLVAQARGGPFVFWDGLASACADAARLGFDAVEIFAPSAAAIDRPALRALLDQHHLAVAALGTGRGLGRSTSWHLTHPDRRRPPPGPCVRPGGHRPRPARWAPPPSSAPCRAGSAKAMAAREEAALAWLAEALHELGQCPRPARPGPAPLRAAQPLRDQPVQPRRRTPRQFLEQRRTGLRPPALRPVPHEHRGGLDIAGALRRLWPRAWAMCISPIPTARPSAAAIWMSPRWRRSWSPSATAGYLSAEVLPLPDSETAAPRRPCPAIAAGSGRDRRLMQENAHAQTPPDSSSDQRDPRPGRASCQGAHRRRQLPGVHQEGTRTPRWCA